jgi:probable HAF family extracellular repeat protein
MRKASSCAVLVVLGIFLLVVAPPAAAAPRYTCLDLNTVPGPTVSSTHPRSISQNGAVAGYAGVASTSSSLTSPRGTLPALPSPKAGGIVDKPFSYKDGQRTSFDCPVPNEGVYPTCLWEDSLEASEEVVGHYKEALAPYIPRAFVYELPPPSQSGGNSLSSSTNWDLGTLGGAGSWANGVNNAGQVVGGSYTASGFQHAFFYSNGVMQDLLPGVISSEASAINNAGQVVGVAGGTAFLWSGGELQDLGTLQAPYNATSYAYAINAAGQVVGSSSSSIGDSHAFLWKDNVMHDLGTLPDGLICEAYGINDYGQVVGYSASATDTRAFLYRGGAMLDLTSLVQNLPAGEVLMIAYGINNRGQIIADGIRGHGYLLTPMVSTGAPIDLLLLE